MNNITLSGEVRTSPTPKEKGCEFLFNFINPGKNPVERAVRCVQYSNSQVIGAGRYIVSGGINSSGDTLLIEVGKMIQIHSDDLTLNNFCLVGRAGKDPEIKYLEDQMSVAKVSLASRKNKEATDWFQVEAWNKTAEIMKNYLRKGSLFAAQGKLVVNEWTSNEETHRQSAICVVSSLELLGSKKDEALPF